MKKGGLRIEEKRESKGKLHPYWRSGKESRVGIEKKGEWRVERNLEERNMIVEYEGRGWRENGRKWRKSGPEKCASF